MILPRTIYDVVHNLAPEDVVLGSRDTTLVVFWLDNDVEVICDGNELNSWGPLDTTVANGSAKAETKQQACQGIPLANPSGRLDPGDQATLHGCQEVRGAAVCKAHGAQKLACRGVLPVIHVTNFRTWGSCPRQTC